MTIAGGSSVHASVATMTAADPLRRKFFHKLGIETTHDTTPPTSALCTTQLLLTVGTRISPPSAAPDAPGFERSSQKDFVHPRTLNLALTNEPLKYNRLEDEVNNSNLNGSSNNTLKRRKTTPNPDSSAAAKPPRKRCMFNESVEVIPIPMRSEYSHRVRSRLWSGAMEIQEMAARNTVEFASEGWDWRNCIQDESMYICRATGELIHPVHYEQVTMYHHHHQHKLHQQQQQYFEAHHHYQHDDQHGSGI